MKKIDLTQKLINQHGDPVTGKMHIAKPVVEDNGEVAEDLEEKIVFLTLGKLMQDALIRSVVKTELEETMTRYDMYQKIYDKDEIELTDDEIETFKKYINNRYEVLLAGQAIRMLEA